MKRKVYLTLVIVIFLLGALLRFYNLDRNELWGDELSAVISSGNVAKYGLPLVKEVNFYRWIKSNYPFEINSDKIWIYQPWGEFYLMALSLLLLGSSEFSVRLPFVICGMLAVIFIYLLTRELYDKDVAFYSLFMSSLSIVLINYSRQALYYMLEILGLVACFYFFIRALKKNKFKYWVFSSFSFVLLFYSNYAFSLPALATIVLYYGYLNKGKFSGMFNKNFISWCLIIFSLTAPWSLYYFLTCDLSGISHYHEGRFFHTLIYIVISLLERLPIPLFLIGIFLLIKNFKRHLFLGIWLILYLLFPLLIGYGAFRGLLPFYISSIILIALVLKEIGRFISSRIGNISKYVIYVLLLLTVCTSIFTLQIYKISIDPNVTNLWSLNRGRSLFSFKFPITYKDFRYLEVAYEPFRCELCKYITSLRTDFYGPSRATVKLLNNKAEENDVVITNADSLPIIFYTNLSTYHLTYYSQDFFINLTKNNNLWFVHRSAWRIQPTYASIVSYWINNCTEYTLNAPDLVFSNNPQFPIYNVPPDLEKLKVYYCKKSQ